MRARKKYFGVKFLLWMIQRKRIWKSSRFYWFLFNLQLKDSFIYCYPSISPSLTQLSRIIYFSLSVSMTNFSCDNKNEKKLYSIRCELSKGFISLSVTHMFQVLYLLFVSLDLIKIKFMWKVQRGRIREEKSGGWRNFLQNCFVNSFHIEFVSIDFTQREFSTGFLKIIFKKLLKL